MNSRLEILMFVLILPISFQCLSQRTKRKVIDNETFYVLKEDKKTKHGSYKREGSIVKVSGQYEMNKKVAYGNTIFTITSYRSMTTQKSN